MKGDFVMAARRVEMRMSLKSSARAGRLLALCLLIGLALAPAAFAGGFQLSAEVPAANNDPELKDAVLVLRTFGCYQPTDAALSGTAEGIVNGRRQSVALELSPTSKGVVRVKQQWPSEGTWVLAITGSYRGMVNSLIVELGPGGKVRPETRLVEGSKKGKYVQAVHRRWGMDEIDSALKAAAGQIGWTPNESGREAEASPRPPVWVVAGMGAFLFVAGLVTMKRRSRRS
jgi:hypothetical protein